MTPIEFISIAWTTVWFVLGACAILFVVGLALFMVTPQQSWLERVSTNIMYGAMTVAAINAVAMVFVAVLQLTRLALGE